MSKDNPNLDKVSLELDLVLANGFDCHVCDSKSFSYNAMGLVICGECGVVYHIHALKKIYN
jgi:transcription elongation factor Elf1